VTQLGLESPASISSDIASQNSVENVRPPSVVSHGAQMSQFSDCSMQQQVVNQTHMHMAIQQHNNMAVPSSSPQQAILNNINNQNQQTPSRSKIQQNLVHQQQQQQQQQQQLNRGTPVAVNSRSATPKSVRNTSTPSLQQQQQQQQQSSQQTSAQQQQRQQRTSPNQQQQQMISPGQQHHIQHNLNLQQQQQSLQAQQQMQQYHLSASMTHGHHQSMHQDYLPVPSQMGGAASQNFSAQSPNSYSSIPMTTVIQQRMSGSHPSSNTTHNPLPSPHQQRLGPSPSSCAVGNNNFYLQGTSHTPIPVPTPTPTPSATPTLQMNSSNPSSGQSNISGCSLSKLQQLTNGLDMIQPCNTPPSGSVNLTPPPNHHPHNTMTPPPPHLVQQNRNLPTPPASLQPQMSALQYHKYYAGSMNVAPGISVSQNSSRVRNTASAPVQHMSAGSSRSSPNVTISPNLMSPYSPLNGYRLTAQQPVGSVSSYITNSATGGFNPGQLPGQMGVMNMQSQYQAQAQQNSMYSTYAPYIPLNGTMRR
jgi:histone acetyltransferase MYST4